MNRTRIPDGKYKVNTIACAFEVLKIFGQEAIQEVFRLSEVLSLRNLFGEGVSITHEEWRNLWPELTYFSERFTNHLLENYNNNEPEQIHHEWGNLWPDFSMTTTELLESPHIGNNTWEWLNEEKKQLIFKILETHLLQGDSRLCNKLLSFLSHEKIDFHDAILPKAKDLYRRITHQILDIYTQQIANIDLKSIEDQIDQVFTENPKVAPKQTDVSRIPKWYSSSKFVVDKRILLQLLFQTDEAGDWSRVEYASMKSKTTEGTSDSSQAQVINHICTVFNAEYIHSAHSFM